MSILKDSAVNNNSKDEKAIIYGEPQDCLFQDDLGQKNCPICLEDIFQVEYEGSQEQIDKSCEKLKER